LSSKLLSVRVDI